MNPSLNTPRSDSPSVALFLPSLAGGGAERVFVQLANRFAAMGVSTHLVLAEASGPYLPEVHASVQVIDLRAVGVTRSLGKLTGYLRQTRPAALLSALESSNLIAVLATRLSRRSAKSVITIRALPSAADTYVSTARTKLLRWLCRIVFPFADRVIANSYAVADDAANFLRMDRGRFDVIYNPLENEQIERLSQEQAGHEWLDNGDIPVVLAVGRLDVLKGFSDLLRAFSLLANERPCRLVILGEGDEREALNELAGQLGLGEDQMVMPGFVTNPFSWIARADVVVSSSIAEGFPNVILQALACGTPVVSTRSDGGATEILEDGKWGEIVPIGDESQMAAAIGRAIDRPAMIDLKERARDFDPQLVAERYLHVLLPATTSQSLG